MGRRAEKLDTERVAEDELDAGVDHGTEALPDPAARVGRSLDDEAILCEIYGAQRLEPDAVGGLVDDRCKLGLHPRPYVIELIAHGASNPLPSWRQCETS